MLRHWLNLCWGEVRVRVTGATPARFFNVCAAQEIVPRRVRRQAWDCLELTLSLHDFRRLRRYMGRTGCRVHIVRRQGAPFLLHRLQRRPVLLLGGVCLGLLWWLLVTRLWVFDVTMDAALPQGEIMALLAEQGVKIGVARDSFDPKLVRFALLQVRPDITFFALNVQGNSLHIEVRGGMPEPEVIDTHAPATVYAVREGVIASLRVQEGAPLVAVGQAVTVGQELVSGLVPPLRETGSWHYARAQAQVQAYTARSMRVARVLGAGRKVYTGREKTQFALLFGNKRLNLYLGSGIAGGSCDKIVETKSAMLSDTVCFPVRLVKTVYRFYTLDDTPQTAQAVQTDLLRRSLSALQQDMDGYITGLSHTVTEAQGAAFLTLRVRALEQIGAAAEETRPLPAQIPPEKSE